MFSVLVTEAYFGSGTTTRLSAVAIGNILVITMLLL